jgi:Glycosyl hydrolases family 28
MNFESYKKRLSVALLKIVLTAASLVSIMMVYGKPPKIKITILPNQPGLITTIIQKAIDSCGENGGGIVFFLAGNYITGGIQLKSKVTLQTEQGTIIQGSDQYTDYKNDAFIFGENLTDIAILGEGIIDGVDCKNPEGEEGFRGPHAIKLVYCKNISIKGITIKNSANWAINCRYCSNAVVENVLIRAGHDGIHTRFCSKFTVTGCDFRTGDDAFAGNDNQDFLVTDCKVNTSCNGFRFGCLNLTVRRCKFWGPGEYIHKIQKRNNMLAAFVHFSPVDESPQLISGNWLIDDITVENVDHFYIYNYDKGLWQTGQPVTNLRFKEIKATGLLGAFNIVGDSSFRFNLSIQNSSFSFREGETNMADSFEGTKIKSTAFFNASNFNMLKLKKVTFEKKGSYAILNCTSGNSLILNDTKFISGQSLISTSIKAVKEVKNDGLIILPFVQ